MNVVLMKLTASIDWLNCWVGKWFMYRKDRESQTAPLPITQKIEQLLGWTAKTTFEEGVALMLENIDYWAEALVWDPSSIEYNAGVLWFKYLGTSDDG